jgi:putative membrane protein
MVRIAGGAYRIGAPGQEHAVDLKPFRIDRTEVRLDQGVLFRQSRRIRIDRLQAVDVVRPLVARIFGLTDLKLEVAGGSGSDIHLAFLKHDEALRIRQLLLEHVAALKATSAPARPATAPGTGADVPGPPVPADLTGEGTPFVEVPGDLLMRGLLRSALPLVTVPLLGLAALVCFGAGVGMTLGLSPQYGVPVLAGSVLGGLGLIGLSVLGAWSHYSTNYRFRVSDTAQGLRIQRGLFQTVSQTVPLERVQGIAVIQPLLWRSKRWMRLEVDVAGYAAAGTEEGSSPVLLPVGDPAMVAAVLDRVLPAGRIDLPQERAGRGARWLRPVGWRYLGCGADEEYFVATHGWLVRRTMLVPHTKTQSVRIVQGPLQRRLGLADVHVDTPPGPVHAVARHRPADRARGVADEQRDRAARARAEEG